MFTFFAILEIILTKIESKKLCIVIHIFKNKTYYITINASACFFTVCTDGQGEDPFPSLPQITVQEKSFKKGCENRKTFSDKKKKVFAFHTSKNCTWNI